MGRCHRMKRTTPLHPIQQRLGLPPQQHNLSYNPKLATVPPDIMTFNGTAFQYKAHPLQVHVSKRIHVWFLEAATTTSSATP